MRLKELESLSSKLTELRSEIDNEVAELDRALSLYEEVMYKITEASEKVNAAIKLASDIDFEALNAAAIKTSIEVKIGKLND